MESQSPPKKERETFGAYIQIVGPVFYARQLSDKAKLLYGLLAAMTQPPLYYAFARNATLCRYLDCSERTLQKYLKELTERNEIVIENGEGGRQLRKIKVARLQPVYPAESCGVYPAESCGGNNIDNNKQKKNGKPAASPQAVLDWLDAWAAKLNADPADTIDLISDLHMFVDNRAAKRKPVLTIRAASLITGRLKSYTQDVDMVIPAMRYILRESVEHNWDKLYPIKDGNADDFRRWLADVYGLAVTPDPPPGRTEGWD